MRNRTASFNRPSLHFRRWARKGYAVFASLGKQVRICQLRTDMCAGEERKACRGQILDDTEHLATDGSHAREETPPDQTPALLALSPAFRPAPSNHRSEPQIRPLYAYTARYGPK